MHRLLCAVIVLVGVLGGLFGPGASAIAESNLLWVGGTGGTLAENLTAAGWIRPGQFGDWETILGGAYRDHGRVEVEYPASLWPVTGMADPSLGDSIAIGAANLEAMACSMSGSLVLAGVSQGAMVVQQVQAVLADDPRIPKDTLFIIIANPNLGLFRNSYRSDMPVLDYQPQPLAETRFRTVVVINQYDGFADPIAQPLNMLTVLNALMGLIYIHPWTAKNDLAAVPQSNITTTVNSVGGITSTYRVPAEQLPLTMPMRQIGIPPALVDRIDAVLRPIIDSGYRPAGTVLPTRRIEGTEAIPSRRRDQQRPERDQRGTRNTVRDFLPDPAR